MKEKQCKECYKSFKGYEPKKFCSPKCYWKNKKKSFLGKNNSMWKGGIIKAGGGYIKILNPEHPYSNRGYVLEHRLVMEKSLGRYLNKNEVVHHLNHNKKDNRIKNLKLMSKIAHDTMHLKEVKRKGYTFDKSRNKWYVSISIDGKMKYFGRYKTEKEAKKRVSIIRLNKL